MAKNARDVFARGASKAGGKSELPKDPGKHFVPGFLGRSKLRTEQGRVGYTKNETRFGPGGGGRQMTLPTGGANKDQA